MRCDSYWPAALLLLGAAGATNWDLVAAGIWGLGMMARRGNGEQREKGALERRARDWACALRWCACVSVCMCVDVCLCLCLCVFALRVILVLVAFALMSSVMGHSLDWPWNGPVSRLCARTDGTGEPASGSIARILIPELQTQIQEIREQVRDRVGLEPVARWPPWLPAWGRRLSSAPGSLLPGSSGSRLAGRRKSLSSLSSSMTGRAHTTRRDTIRPDTASAQPTGLCHPAE